jgi:hypothetical protein
MAGFGVFMETTDIFNRGREAVSVRFDGQEKTIPPGITRAFPKIAFPYARKQNPIMGTQSFTNPTASGYDSLIVDMNGKNKDKAVPLTDEEWAKHCNAPSNLNIEEMEEEKGVKLKAGRKNPKKVMANTFEAREGVSGSEFDGLDQHAE